MVDEIYKEIARINEHGEEAALATIVAVNGSAPREMGAKMLVRIDGSIVGTIGGGSLEARVIKEAMQVIKKGLPQRFQFNLTAEKGELGMICGGDTEVFIEPIVSVPAMYIFGGGHISLALAQIGKLLGFKITVIDERVEFASPQRFPEADLVLAEKVDTAFSKLTITKSSFIVIVTHGHQHDEHVLELAVCTEARYIGMIGSEAKNKAVLSHLLARGISQERLDKVYAPIGLDINAQTPEEIAVSIMAEIIKVRRSPL